MVGPRTCALLILIIALSICTQTLHGYDFVKDPDGIKASSSAEKVNSFFKIVYFVFMVIFVNMF